MLKHWLYGSGIRVFFAEGGGDDGGGGGEGGDHAPDWHADYQGVGAENLKLLTKYDSVEKALASVADKENMIRQPFRLPKDVTKLSEEQAAEFNKGINTIRGVPETVEGYKFTTPEGTDVAIDNTAMADFKQACLEEGVPLKAAQRFLEIQIGLVGRLNEARAAAIKDMTTKNHEQYVKEKGSEADADLRQGYVKEYLQSFCLGEDGQPDKDVWEAFAARILHEDRIIELPLLRALEEPARMARAGGGAPAGGAGERIAPGALSYPEMRKK